MPIYEYECRQCGHRFEYLLLSTSPAAECPSCRKKDLNQLISLSAMSSETTRDANFSAAHKKASVDRQEKHSEQHEHLHQHFEDDAKS
jgi:putative FmdB family regulatory protein